MTNQRRRQETRPPSRTERPAQGHTPFFSYMFPRAELGLVLLAMMTADFFRIPEVGLEPTISSLGGRRLIH